ncbi:MAG TPA: tRNA (N6-isopentenyl adenosine(37)-C2)-methylthiotransferase MiaB [Acidimicrobiales bacterium]|nr:tRNA (N6-isopentenyl adenosine(37)-C2)-methylthiotransferase MiaB [Acidimicrobiales bacterium]
MSRTFHIRTFGCQMNEHDSERIAALLVADGLEPVADVSEADVVVLNTCCIRENADNRLYGHLGALKALRDSRPGMQIAVGGCLAQKDREVVRQRAGHVDVVFGTHNLIRAPALLREAAERGPVVEVLDSPLAEGEHSGTPGLDAVRESACSAWVTIQTGCDNSCAFCIVPQVRGPEVSRPFGVLVEEVESLASRGVSEITLLGQNVNSYGRDITRRRPLFAQLLRALGAVDGIRRVRFTSPHPKDLRPETIAAMAETEAVCEHLHLPLQAGSDRVLAAMRRGYTAERYLSRLAAARAAVVELAVTTDVIVGFPGETDDDFERTLEVVAEAEYDSAYTFVFSPRPGTRAAAMEEQFVAQEVVAERFERLRVVVERSALARHARRVGMVEEVLVEGPSKKDATMLSGRTRQNKLVHFSHPAAGSAPCPGPRSEGPPAGSFATVKITRAAPHHLRGELVSFTAPKSRRRRLPVSAG